MFLYSTVSTLKPEIVTYQLMHPFLHIAIEIVGLEMGSDRGVGLRTNCGNSRNDLTKLELVENSGLSGSIETDHQNSHLLLSPQTVEQPRECDTHVGGVVCVIGLRVCCGGDGGGRLNWTVK